MEQDEARTANPAVSTLPSGGAAGFGPGAEALSIVIPTYNCADYLRVTLASLADQGIEDAQVVVVDDCSTADDPEAVVAESGLPGVSFHRQPRNLGLVGNFNSCIERAQRPWVQLLHGDDLMLPGGYAELDRAIATVPAAGFVAGRCVMVDELGLWDGLTRLVGPADRGPLPYDPMRWRLNPLQFAGVAFRKDAVAAVGPFRDRYAHCADWDLWWRLARSVPTAYTNTCVGGYRRFAGSHTATLVRSAGNLTEGLALVHEIAAAEPATGVAIYAALFDLTVDQCRRVVGDDDAFRAHVRLLRSFPRGLPKARRLATLAYAHLKARAQGRVGYEEER